MADITRRETLRLGLTTAAGLALVPEWALPAFEALAGKVFRIFGKSRRADEQSNVVFA